MGEEEHKENKEHEENDENEKKNEIHVHFGQNNIKIYEDDRLNNFNDEYRRNRENNIRLASMERYFRKMHLLEKYEMLSFSDVRQRHLRTDFLICIADNSRWIDYHEYLYIHTK